MLTDLRDLHRLGQGTYQRLLSAERCPGLDDLGITMSGLSLCQPGYLRCETRPAHALIAWVLDDAGEGEFLCDGAWRPAPPGMVYLAPAQLRRALRCQTTWHIAWLDVRSDHGRRRLPKVPTCRPGDGGALAETMRLLWREHLRREPAPLALAHLLPLMGLHLQRLLGEHGLPSRLERLWQTVDADLAAPWTLHGLARELGVGPERLRRLCQERYGESPAARLRRLRLDRAAALLTATDLSIAEIAAAIGYTDPESFTTAFRRQHGRPPRSHRREG